ncbi:MAG: M20/M25/M40 family metallo-hydrolase [Thermoleophilia bacterium]
MISAYNVNFQMAQIAELASEKYEGRRTGSAGARAAASYISSQFASLGLKPWSAISPGSYLHHFAAGGLESDNVIGVIPGTDPGGTYVILAGHYDHLGMDPNGQPFNGADDNAAGVAALLETARVIKQQGLTPVKTIVFCAFSGEEEGEYGARALGSAITNAGLAGKVEMINIDGIGATGGSYFGVWDEGAAEAAPLVRTMQRAGQYLETTVREEGTDIGSDAQPFNWQFGIPAVTVDWDWGSDPSTYHPYYHTIYDDADKIDSVVLARATKVAMAGLWLRATSQ